MYVKVPVLQIFVVLFILDDSQRMTVCVAGHFAQFYWIASQNDSIYAHKIWFVIWTAVSCYAKKWYFQLKMFPLKNNHFTEGSLTRKP